MAVQFLNATPGFADNAPAGAAKINANFAELYGNVRAAVKMFTFASVAAMVAAPYLQAGDTVLTQGYFAAGDGGTGLYRIVAPATGATDGGLFIDLVGSTGQAAIIVLDVIELAWYGLDRTGVTACDVQINAAIQSAISAKKKLIWPNGLFQIANPLLCYSGTFSTLQMEGQGGPALGNGRVNYTYPGGKTNPNTILWANFNNRPALIYNAVRDGSLENICILGNNLNTAGSFSSPFPPSAISTDWVTNSCRDSRYSPYAGICFDPFNAATPADGGYPGMTYPQSSGSGSHGVTVNKVGIYGFTVGVMVGPTGTGSNGDVLIFRDVTVGWCRISYASGESQAREFVITGGNASNCHCVFDTITYGAQNAPPPQVSDVQLGDCYSLINYNSTVGASKISRCHVEQFMCIGRGGSPSSLSQPLVFEACDITLFNQLTYPVDTGPGCPPAVMTCGGPTKFTGCTFNYAGHVIEAWNFVSNDGTAYPVFESCVFSGSIEAHRIPPIGIERARSNATLINCWINGSGIGGQSQTISDNLYRGNNSLSIIWGNSIGRLNATVQTCRVPDVTNGINLEYAFIPGGVMQGGTANVGSITAMTLNATTVTFTRVNAGQFFCENDILTYSMLPKFGVTIGAVPALKIPVGGISGNNVTANMLWNPAEYDIVANQPGAGNQIDIVVNQWAPTGALTCTTHGTTSLTGVSPVGTLLPGDFVIGAGANASDIPNVVAGAVRVVSNDGAGNVVISKAANGSHAGVGLRFGYLSPVTPVIVTVANLPPGIAGLRYMVSDALAPVYGSAVAGGGAVQAPVFWSTSALAWIVG